MTGNLISTGANLVSGFVQRREDDANRKRAQGVINQAEQDYTSSMNDLIAKQSSEYDAAYNPVIDAYNGADYASMSKGSVTPDQFKASDYQDKTLRTRMQSALDGDMSSTVNNGSSRDFSAMAGAAKLYNDMDLEGQKYANDLATSEYEKAYNNEQKQIDRDLSALTNDLLAKEKAAGLKYKKTEDEVQSKSNVYGNSLNARLTSAGL